MKIKCITANSPNKRIKRSFDYIINDNKIKEDKIHVNSDSDEESEMDDDNVYSQDNHIYFRTGVNKQSMELLIKKIRYLNNKYQKLSKDKLIKTCTPNFIYLHITSYGGTVFEALKIMDVIERSTLPIHTIIDGYAASAGSLIALYGVKRYMTKNASCLVHEISSFFAGRYKFKEQEDDMANSKYLMEKLINIYAEKTNLSVKKLKKIMKHDLWWDFDKCKKYGLVHEEWNKTNSYL